MNYGVDVAVEPARPLEAGREVTVRVTGLADAAVKCRAIECSVLWRTEGRGDDDGATVFQGVDQGGELQPDVPIEAVFRFRVPDDGPITYAGRLLSIRWFLRVSLDIPWRFDPKREFELTVVPRAIE